MIEVGGGIHGANRLAQQLERDGIQCAAIHGDKSQSARTRALAGFRAGECPVLIATDIASRGIDVDDISHVFNYDLPQNADDYVHRIGRTGRAGRQGDAILFVAPRERRMLGAIEKATRKKIDIMELPSTELINDKRIARFKQRITDTLASDDLELFSSLIEQYQQEHNVPAVEIAAATATTATFIRTGSMPGNRGNRSGARRDRDPRRSDTRRSVPQRGLNPASSHREERTLGDPRHLLGVSYVSSLRPICIPPAVS